MITAYITCDWGPVDEYKLKMQQSKTTHYLSISTDEFWLINHWLWRRLSSHETMKSLTFRDQYYPHARVRSGNMDLEGAKSKSIKKSYIFVVNPLRGLQWTAATPTRPGMSFMLFFPRHIIFLSDTLGRHSLYGCMLQSVWWMWKVPTLASCCPAL